MKHVRDTSIKAWSRADTKASAMTLGERVFCLLQNQEATGAEVNRALENNHAHKRLSELKRGGLIEETGRRICAVSGNESYAWRAIPGGIYTAEKPQHTPYKREDLEVGFRQLIYLVQIAKREMGYEMPHELEQLGRMLREKYGRKKDAAGMSVLDEVIGGVSSKELCRHVINNISVNGRSDRLQYEFSGTDELSDFLWGKTISEDACLSVLRFGEQLQISTPENVYRGMLKIWTWGGPYSVELSAGFILEARAGTQIHRKKPLA